MCHQKFPAENVLLWHQPPISTISNTQFAKFDQLVNQMGAMLLLCVEKLDNSINQSPYHML